jgi:hypothetical protein
VATQFLLDHGLARVINLGSTGDRLQSDQRTLLIQLADNLLKAQSLTAIIAPGDRYLDDHGHVVTATAPLRFTLTLALGDDQAPGINGSCYQFCSDPSFGANGQMTSAGWPTRLAVMASWAIADANGQRLTGPGYQAGQHYPSPGLVEVNIQLTAIGWKITGLDGASAQAITEAAGAMVGQAVSNVGGGGYGSSFLQGLNLLDGCMMDVHIGGDTQHTPRVLWRFGVLLAVNADARQVFPQLPVATAAEQALAAHIAQQQPTLRDDSILPAG